MNELRKILQEFCFRAAGGQVAEHVAHGQTRTPHARLPKAHRRVNGDPLKQVRRCRLMGFQVDVPKWA